MTDPDQARTGSDRLVAKAFGRSSEHDLADAVGKLSPREAEVFLRKLEAALRKRKIMLSGYLVAMVVWVIAMAGALAYFGMASGFVGWVLLAPFALVGLILWWFGAWADKASRAGSLPAPSHPDRAHDSHPESGAK